MSVSYQVLFNTDLGIESISNNLGQLFDIRFEIEKGDDRCIGDLGPISIAYWWPHGFENDRDMEFERFVSVIGVSGSSGLEREISEAARKAHGWVLETYDASAMLVRDLQQVC